MRRDLYYRAARGATLKRIYLDQNKWIELLVGTESKKTEAALMDVLRLSRFGVEVGALSFPLSMTHYMETSFRRDWESRRGLARLMASISRFHAIATRAAIIPHEIDVALHGAFGKPAQVRTSRVFGYGILHAVYTDPLVPVVGSAELAAAMEQLGRHFPASAEREARELALLSGPSPAEEDIMPDYRPVMVKTDGEEWAARRDKQRELRRSEGWARGERAERVALAETLASEGAFWERASAVGVSPEEVLALGREGMTTLVRAIPLMDVMCELGRLRDTADSRVLSSNDLADVGFLGPAVVYCDVVVTEKQWADFARRAGLGQKYGTTIVSDLRDLPALLV